MGWFLLAHIGIPLLFAIAFIIFASAADPKPLGWESCTEIGLDFAILSLGATGAIFVNPKLFAAFGPNAALLGIVVIGVNLILASILVYKKRVATAPISWKGGISSLFLGALALSITCGVFAWGYRVAPAATNP